MAAVQNAADGCTHSQSVAERLSLYKGDSLCLKKVVTELQ